MFRQSISLFSILGFLYDEWNLLVIVSLSRFWTLRHGSFFSASKSVFAPSLIHYNLHSSPKLKLSLFLDLLDEQSRSLPCQLEQALGIKSTTIGQLFRTDILSLKLGKSYFGISQGDFLLNLIASDLWDE